MALSFRTVRWLRTLNLVLQALLVLTLFGGLNYLALHHGWRFDLTENRRHSLSPETRSYLASLRADVQIIVTLTDDTDNDEVNQAYRDVSGLLNEYVNATSTNRQHRVSVRYLDVYQQRRDAEAFGIDQPNIILVLSGNNRRVIELSELYRVVNRIKMAFLGEQAFTAAILNVSSPRQQVLYFLQGHGEMRLDDVSPTRGLSVLAAELALRNFAVAPLDLSQSRAIPDDAALVVIAGPQNRFEPFEEELLRQYVANRAGRLLALIPPAVSHGLDNLFFDWGVLADDVFILDSGPAGQNETGDLILYPTTNPHPVITFLANNRIPLRFGASRQVRPDPGRSLDSSLEVIPLLATSETAWGERGYRLRPPFEYNPETDLPGRLAVGTASERTTATGDLPFSVRGGRLVLFGGADWVANGRLAAGGNLSLILASVNWLVDRDTQLNIRARPIERFQLSLSQQQLSRLRYLLLGGLPGVIAVLGFLVYWTRRN